MCTTSCLYIVLASYSDAPVLHPGHSCSEAAQHTSKSFVQLAPSCRGPGAVLGDDAVRDRRLAVGVVAAKDGVVTLRVSPQKFLAALDPLTLRLFSRLRQQQDDTLQVGPSLFAPQC